jgi:hypothetical protein
LRTLLLGRLMLDLAAYGAYDTSCQINRQEAAEGSVQYSFYHQIEVY